ncbi:AAA family ATPase [Pirellulaceae bacterium]|nr:AAA family ATPase [Pirellulaceae bacterium]
MKVHFNTLELTCRESVELVEFSPSVTFIHGPVGTGKSTVARLIDFCLGGTLVRTTAVRSELVSVQLSAVVGEYEAIFERAIDQNSSVRVTWTGNEEQGSVIAPIVQRQDAEPIFLENIFTLSDLIFHFAGVEPIKVRKSKTDPDSKLVRLSFRDVMWYCYLSQENLDSSFFQMDHPFKRNKSIDVMRFVVGFYSDRLNELEQRLVEMQERLRANRIAANQIREFLRRFHLGSDVGVDADMQQVQQELENARSRRSTIEADALKNTHTVDPLRHKLQKLARKLGSEEVALGDLQERVASQEALLADFISAKVKSARLDSARSVLAGVTFERCPQCGLTIEPGRCTSPAACNLCCQVEGDDDRDTEAVDTEILRQDLNTRIDELEELVNRHRTEIEKQLKAVAKLRHQKIELDQKLNRELQQYDSAYVSQIRGVDREIGELEERLRQLGRLAEMPRALEQMELESGQLEGQLTTVRESIRDERDRLRTADARIHDVESAFLSIMLDIGFPGIEAGDRVEISRRNWQPKVFHGANDTEGWGFDDAGSGGKQVLFNVCYALAIHRVAAEHELPLPTFLIIDSPTKNISADVNPTLIERYFKLIYSLADGVLKSTQFILIDSDLVEPDSEHSFEFQSRLLSREDPLISYYDGP